MQGTIVEINVAVGDEVRIGQPVAVVEAMKLQHDIKADRSGVVCAVSMAVGDVVREGYPIVFINEMELEGGAIDADAGAALDHVRGDLQEVYDRITQTLDASHEEAVAARHAMGRRTARENLADLLDEGSFQEFGPPAAGSVAGGTVMGIGTTNADLVGEERGQVAVVHGDYLMATYTHGHYKQEPVHELAHDMRAPLVLFSEGRGDRTATSRASAWTPRSSPTSPGSAAWFRWWASTRGTASPGTQRCWPAVTSSSPPRIPPSA